MKFTIRQICFIAIMTAITGALSILQIPTPWGVPFTLQTFAVSLCGYLLGRRDGTLAVFLYVLLGAIGVPIYSGMTSGIGVVAGTAGGYLIGFIPMAFFCGFGAYLDGYGWKMINPYLFGIIGLAICHIMGIIQLKFVASLSWQLAAMYGTVPYILKDILSVIAAYLISLLLRKALRAAKISGF